MSRQELLNKNRIFQTALTSGKKKYTKQIADLYSQLEFLEDENKKCKEII